MSKNKNPSMLDMGQLWKRVVETQHDALRVINATDVETEFSLSHDSDSIVTKCKSHVIPANQKVNCSHVKRVMAYGSGNITLFANDVQITMPILVAQILEICATDLLCDVPLVGQ